MSEKKAFMCRMKEVDEAGCSSLLVPIIETILNAWKLEEAAGVAQFLLVLLGNPNVLNLQLEQKPDTKERECVDPRPYSSQKQRLK